jgi:hypothetical protein
MLAVYSLYLEGRVSTTENIGKMVREKREMSEETTKGRTERWFRVQVDCYKLQHILKTWPSSEK